MPTNIFDSVDEMISKENLSQIVGTPIVSIERGVLENEGFSANMLERLKLSTSESQTIYLVLKHFDIDNDWLMRLTHDDLVREVALYKEGIYEQLPAECIVPIAAAARESNSWATLMPDVSGMLVPSGDVAVPAGDIKELVDHLAALHTHFMGNKSMNNSKLGLSSEEDWILMLSPQVGQSEVDSGTENDISGNLVFAWNTYWDAAPSEASHILKQLQSDLNPLLKALDEGERTFLHGDVKFSNLGFCSDCSSLLEVGIGQKDRKVTSRTIFLDWGLSMYSSPFIEIGWFLAVNSAKLSIAKEDVIQMYRDSMAENGHLFDEENWQKSLDLGLLAGGALRLIWAKALGTLADDPAIKEREIAEVVWWSEQVIRAGTWL